MFSKKKDYVVNFKIEKYKNNFYHVFNKFELRDFDILNDWLYMDVNDTKENSYLKLIFIVYNFKKTKKSIESINSFVMTHYLRK